MMPQEEAETYLGFLKKALSGTLGRNLLDIEFSTRQVADSGEHRLLMALRDSGLKDSQVRQAFYQKVTDGKKYLLIPASKDMEVNGMPVDWT